MNDDKRSILERVASGELSPDEAARLLSEEPATATGLATAQPPVEPGEPVERVRISRALGTVKVVGDSSVREVVATGPHSVSRENSTLVIEGDDESGEFAFIWAGRQQVRIGRPEARALEVRMNPQLALELETQAGTVKVTGMEGPIKATVQAGSARIGGFRGPLEVDVQAGSLNLSGRLTAGRSKIRCEAASVRMHLDPESSVRITGKSNLARLHVQGGTYSEAEGWQIGSGEATLDVEATMGNVKISAGS